MFEQYFEDYLKHHPTLASFLGDRSRDGEVELWLSESYRNDWGAVLAKYEKKLQNKSNLTYDEMALKFSLEQERKFLSLPFNLMPMSSFSNPVLDFAFMERTVYPPHKENMKRRYKLYGDIFLLCIDNMREGIKEKIMIPTIVCERMIEDIEAFLKHKEYLVDASLESYLKQHYLPCVEKLLRFLKDEYLEKCTKTIGFCDLPKGNDMYEARLISNTSQYVTPEAIHKMGLREVRRIHNAFKKLIPHIYPKQHLDVPSFLQKFKDEPKNFMKNANDILRAYVAAQKRIRKDIIPMFFHEQVTPYEIKRVPKMLEASSAGAFYYPGNKTRPGRFFINLRNTRENPIYTIETLAMHEGEPGHHYQFQYMLDKKLPMYKIFGTEGNAYAEGWALYAESLSPSSDPAVIFGRLTFEMLRAVRCVVDTGIHYYGWSFKRALAYMEKHIALQETELTSELIRYICIPGQATAYKVGENFFKDHKIKFLEKGKSIKDYHKAVLDEGVIPLYVLDKILTNQL